MMSFVRALCRFGFAVLLASGIAVVPALSARAEQPPRSDLVLILDASGSMRGQVKAESKIAIARRVLRGVLGKIPPGANVGLVTYGHRREADCKDIETIVPIGPFDPAALAARIEALTPKGKTPITATLNQVFAELAQREKPATVVFVSDGIETCGGDPCKAVRDARSKGIELILHVVGFDVGEVDVSQLECAAQAGGGLYFSASNAEELGAALDQAVELTPESPTGQLSIKATANGKLTDVLLHVSKADSGEAVIASRTYESADSNPRVLPLPAGTYAVVARAVKIAGSPEQRLADIQIETGKTVEKTIDFSLGKLSVKVTRDGKLSDATVQVYRPGTREPVAAGRTYVSESSNPKVFTINAGTYDVEVGAIEIAGKPMQRWEQVEVTGGGSAERAHDFASGTLRIGASRGGQLIDATVSVRPIDAKQPVAGARTYTSAKSNPTSFVLSPGSYEVTVTPVKQKESAPQKISVTIAAGRTRERLLTFGPPPAR